MRVSRQGAIGGFGIMLLRVVGVLIAATLACAVAHKARAEPRPADACKHEAFLISRVRQWPGA